MKDQFIQALHNSFSENTFVKMTLGNYQGMEADLKKLLIKKILIKQKEQLSIVYRYQTKDITKNFELAEGANLLISFLDMSQFRHANLFTIKKDYQLHCSKKGVWRIQESKASIQELPSASHDKKKNRKIAAKGKQYLYDLKITDAQGNVRPHGQDKYKQINHYIEILSGLLKELPQKEVVHIVDMGSGKGYLTFALYDYLLNVLKVSSKITGVEYRKDLVDLCNTIGAQSNFNHLNFEEGSIENYKSEQDLDVLLALHACDTATDDAIFKGIQANAQLIVVAPCCHKQIRKEMKKGQASKPINELTKHGIFMERQAEMLTDSLRALFLEQADYHTKIFDFIATEHTPKNVMLVAQKRTQPSNNKKEISSKIKDLKEHFGIEKHYLEALLNY